MTFASIEIRARKPTPHTFATVTTSSGLQALQTAIGMKERRTTFQIVPLVEKPGGHPRFDLRADSTNIGAAIDTVRSLLVSLTEAADRGMLGDFEVSRGVDLMHRIDADLCGPAYMRQGASGRPFFADRAR